MNLKKLKKLCKLNLHNGGHTRFSAGHCAMEVVAWLADEEHGDEPSCADIHIASLMRVWNDSFRKNTKARTDWIRPFLPRVVGTKTNDLAIREKRYRLRGRGLALVTNAPAVAAIAPAVAAILDEMISLTEPPKE